MIWIAGTNKLCHFFNKQWLDFTGKTLEQAKGKGWMEAIHPDDFDRCLQLYSAAFDARQEFYREYRLKRYDGQWLIQASSELHKGSVFELYFPVS